MGAGEDIDLGRGGDGHAGQLPVAAVLVVLGLGLLAHPMYLWPHYGQTQVGVDVEPLADTADSGIEYSQLPQAAQKAFRDALAGRSVELWTGEDDRALDAFNRHDGRVRYQGESYRVVLFYSHPGSFIYVFLRWLLTAMSAFLVAYGGLVLHADSWTPFTPIRALWVPVLVTLSFLGTAFYDVTFSGVSGSFLGVTGAGTGHDLIELVAITSAFVVIGSLTRRDGLGSRAVAVGSLLVLIVGAVRYRLIVPVSILLLILYTALGGIVWGTIGYRLTEGPSTDG